MTDRIGAGTGWARLRNASAHKQRPQPTSHVPRSFGLTHPCVGPMWPNDVQQISPAPQHWSKQQAAPGPHEALQGGGRQTP